ncbi:SGNH hydrolase-type esterase domain-containing protein, partial [Mycena rebaudengoi]
MLPTIFHVVCLSVAALATSAPVSPYSAVVLIRHDDPLIFYYGRWDTAPETWWPDSGFKITVQDLSSLTLNLGPNTTFPLVALGVSVDSAPFFRLNGSARVTVIPVDKKQPGATTVVRMNAVRYFSCQMNLESIDLNAGPRLVPFEFIGDSFSTRYTTPDGILIGEMFKAEETVVAQPGVTLVDMASVGNIHGMSFQSFQTKDTSYSFNPVHNYTTPWDFQRDVPEGTHVVVHIGANDVSQNVDQAVFINTCVNFLATIRKFYPHQPFFLFTPWGCRRDGPNTYYYPGTYEAVLEARRSLGVHTIFFVNTTGWVTYADVFPDNLHPSVEGHMKFTGLFREWLE